MTAITAYNSDRIEQRASAAVSAARPDSLRAIQGIGITAENRLYRAGIRSFRELAESRPAELREILGAPRPGVSYEAWIAGARALCK